MKVYFCYEHLKSNDSRTPLRVKKIFANRDVCFLYVMKKEAKEIKRLEKFHGVYDAKEHCDELIQETEVI